MVLMGGAFAAQSRHSFVAAFQPQTCAFAFSTAFPEADGDFYVHVNFECSGHSGSFLSAVQSKAVLSPLSDPTLWLAFHLPLQR